MEKSENPIINMKERKYDKLKVIVVVLVISFLMILLIKFLLKQIPTVPFAVINLLVNVTPRCGDMFCDSFFEDCSTCPADCGNCPTTTTTTAPRQTGPAGGGVGPAPTVPIGPPIELPITPPPEGEIRYNVIAVLKETQPGTTNLIGINVENVGEVNYTDLNVEVTGVPSDWVSVSKDTISLGTAESGGFNVLVTPPPDAEPGDYKVNLKLKNGEIEVENFFIVRVKSVPPDYDKPVVTRSVTIDREIGKTDISIVVTNPSRDVDHIEVIESIPKDLAESTDDVDFKTPPTEIVRKDPIVLWSIFGIEAGKEKEISYSIPKILDEFTQYVYWPLRQLNLVSLSAPENFELVSFNMPELQSGRTSTVRFTVQNPDTSAHDFTFSMEIPPSWSIEPSSIEEIIVAGEKREFHIEVSVPAGEPVGKYIVRTIFGWEDNYIIKEYTADVRGFVVPTMIVHLAGVVCTIAAGYVILKAIKKRKRPKLKKKLEIIKGELAKEKEIKEGAVKEEQSAIEKLTAELGEDLKKKIKKKLKVSLGKTKR